MSDLFWPVFAAVLDAGLLLVGFVWAFVQMSRKESRQEGNGAYVVAVILAFFFAAGATYIAFGGH